MSRSRDTTPPNTWLDWDGVINRLEKSCILAGGQNEWAAKHGISNSYVSDVLRSKCLPGNKITKALGLEKVPLWRTPAR